MTDERIDTDDQIVEDTLPVPPDEPAIPVDLTRQPWHLPRKQFIRERQWAYFAKRLVDDQTGQPGLNLPNDRPEVRYLNLPGIDYLDTRLMGQVCNDLGCELTATGFLAGVKRKPEIARAKVREDGLIKAGYISDRSHTLSRRFEEVADPNGPTYRDIRRRGPFHIVNIDACGSMAGPSSHHSRRLIDAVYHVLAMQFRYHASPWLFFLTTDARPDSVAEDTVRDLWSTVEQNASHDVAFRKMVNSIFGLPDDDSFKGLPRSVSEPGFVFLQLLSLAFGKWALHLAHENHRRLKAHSIYCYSTTPQGDSTPTMVCLAYEVWPQPPNHDDPSGVAAESGSAPVVAASESDATRVARKVKEMTNLDEKLMQESKLNAEMSSNLKHLLAEAGYPEDVLQQG